MSQRIEVEGSPTVPVSPAEWQRQVDELRAMLVDRGFDPVQCAADMRTAFGDITFRDGAGQSGRHDGTAWWRWDTATWVEAVPPAELFIATVVFDVDDEVDETPEDEDWGDGAPEAEPAPAWGPPSAGAAPASGAASGPASGAAPAYRRTHTVPAAGLRAWAEPDGMVAPVASLDPWLDVEVLEQRADGWAHVRCSNGWEAWVDGRALAPVGA